MNLRPSANCAKKYGADCRRAARGEAAKVLAAKQQLELAVSQTEGIRAELAEQEQALDQIQGLEAEESRRRQVQQDFERAGERLAASQAEIARLKAEYLTLAEKLRLAEWHFHEALRMFNLAKEANARVIAQ
jgi:ABC-type phosphate transport system auxiliary subunit